MPFAFQADGGVVYRLNPDEPAEARGGVRANWEGLALACDHVLFRQSPLPGGQGSALAEADLVAGPAGPQGASGAHVVIDTRGATGTQIGFRGLLTPGIVHISRRAADARRPGLAQFDVSLRPLGDFSGLLADQGAWLPYTGWAEHGELVVEADIVAGSLVNTRLRSLVLYGQTGEHQGRRRAWVQGPRTAALSQSLPGGANRPASDLRSEGRILNLMFKPDGAFDGVGGSGMTIEEVPRL